MTVNMLPLEDPAMIKIIKISNGNVGPKSVCQKESKCK